MSFLDKLASAIMPPETAEDRDNARRLAQAAAGNGDWLALVIDHHRQIEQHFSRALTAPDAQSRQSALKALQVLLTGHANAEESVLYPALADHGGKAHATMAYEEQAMTKVELALLEPLDPMGKAWREKLEHIQGAVLHHAYEEEGTWFPELQQNLPADERQRLTRRFLEEFDRYAQGGADETPWRATMQQAAESFGSDSAPGAR
ncbi:hemerythrin domain-containing protein [Novosphingobium flavum]|uniref:Hemerythrin domain-containing protein n=1 Tax=Novosphingobium aerophilum TaxID=2839843 RepID=A0A7X1F7M5_9SPHN|nr:hemerythrin domain-containing protein [Novosphingobium aerophilum]MBC2651871.1 hemerythrin domain-containing protein [Novosphingobium aerophilum]MBC2661730.1 hemerythrin domain-containing protein [Novosphingobium aerophilum]